MEIASRILKIEIIIKHIYIYTYMYITYKNIFYRVALDLKT